MIERNRLRQWLTSDRVLALVGLISSVVLSVLGILASIAQSYFVLALVASIILVVLISAPLLVLLREPRRGIRLHPFPYKITLTQFTTSIVDAKGTLAIFRHEEDIVCLQDHVVTVRRAYWGDWGNSQLTDLRCLTPKGAQTVDVFKEGYNTVFVISLRHIYNLGDTFKLTVELTVHDGFTNPEHEYTSWSIIAQIDTLVLKAVLPKEKVLVPGTAKLRFSMAGTYDELILPETAISYTEDGRQQIIWRELQPHQNYTYGIHWSWRERKTI